MAIVGKPFSRSSPICRPGQGPTPSAGPAVCDNTRDSHFFFSIISGLTHVNIPVMLMPDDFKAFSKIRVDNHNFNKLVYIVEKHGKTLLPRYLGLYRLTVDGTETYFVVMKNIFSSTLKVHCKYDLKGMTVDREASVKEKVKDLPTLKDGDFIQDGCKLHVGTEQKEKLIATLTSDVEFLQRFHLTEYSVCVGIHDCQLAEEEEEKRDRSDDNDDCEDEGSEDSATAVPTPPDSPRIISILVKKDPPPLDPYAVRCSEDYSRREIYFIALVDILSHGAKKRTATISGTQPEQYAKRLVDFMSKAML
ncbi:UNVERIFIED_CONTAM: Pip4k2b [Trichonephila clavipes]